MWMLLEEEFKTYKALLKVWEDISWVKKALDKWLSHSFEKKKITFGKKNQLIYN